MELEVAAKNIELKDLRSRNLESRWKLAKYIFANDRGPEEDRKA